MAKTKSAKRKSSAKRSAPVQTDAAQPQRGGERPAADGSVPGQLLFDMPYSASSPRLISADLGLHNLVTRAGHNAGYTIDVTLLDAPDHRLIRSGVLLAHRVLDGRGEWYLGAPGWTPLLPEERVEPMAQADLPEEFADLVRPFRRRATLGPVAALTCERREFALRDDHGTTMALLRDEKVTVRRGGLTTARFREVMLTPAGPGLTEEQVAHVRRQLIGAGATQVPRFPRLVVRLGAPATGPTDFPDPQPLNQQPLFAQFVSTLFARRVRQIVEADLAIRGGDVEGAAKLRDSAARMLTELGGLTAVLDPEWTVDLDEELSWLVEEAAAESGRPASEQGTLAALLRGERYLTLLERLVTAIRSPRVGDSSSDSTPEVLEALLEATANRVRRSAADLTVDADPAAWEVLSVALTDLFQVCDVAVHVLPRQAEDLRTKVMPWSEKVAEATGSWLQAAAARSGVAEASVGEAFELGRSYERSLAEARRVRGEFLEGFPKVAKKLGP